MNEPKTRLDMLREVCMSMALVGAVFNLLGVIVMLANIQLGFFAFIIPGCIGVGLSVMLWLFRRLILDNPNL